LHPVKNHLDTLPSLRTSTAFLYSKFAVEVWNLVLCFALIAHMVSVHAAILLFTYRYRHVMVWCCESRRWL